MKRITIFSLALLMLFAGCKSMKKSQIGAGAGAAAGAVVGGIIAKNSAVGAIIGAAVGGTAGYIIGRAMDKQAEELKQAIPDAQVERVGEGINLTMESGLLFREASPVLSQEALSTLDKLAEVLAKYPDTDLLIEGHTSDNGDPNNTEPNLELSRKRAQAVSDYLASHKVASSRITTKWYGKSQPKYPNDTEANRALNRRVEVAITANEAMKKKAEEGKL